MGVERVIFYSIRCNKCSCLLEDFTGELARLTEERSRAEAIAKEEGFVQVGANSWLCPHCFKIATYNEKKNIVHYMTQKEMEFAEKIKLSI